MSDSIESVVPGNIPDTRLPRPSSHKVAVGATAGAMTIVVVWIAGLWGLDVPASVAQAFTILAATGLSILVPDDMEAP